MNLPSLIALVFAVVFPTTFSPAVAQDEAQPGWFGSSFDNYTVLAFGVPDSDYVVLSFSCRLGASIVHVSIQDGEPSAEDGELLLVRLASGDSQVEFSEKALTNEDSGGIEVYADLPLDEALRHILTAETPLEIMLGGHMLRYAMDGAAEPGAHLLAACDAPKPASDLDVTVTNKATLPLQSLGYSEAGSEFFDSDAFGYDLLAPGASRTFTIPDGRDVCIFDISVLFAEEEEEECCSMAAPVGTQDFCENSEFIVHD